MLALWGNSVDGRIAKDVYLGVEDKLCFPKVDDLVREVRHLGPGCLCFKHDLQRAYHQIFVDWKDIPLLEYIHNNSIFFNAVLPMGLQSSARCCQHVTDTIVFLFVEKGYFAGNYLGDFGGVSTVSQAWQAFTALGDLLRAVGIQEASEKAAALSTRMIFLGIQVDTVELSLTILEEKLQDLIHELQSWSHKSKATLKEVQQLARKLNFAASCIQPAHIYICQILNFLRSLKDNRKHVVPVSVRSDVQWWLDCAKSFNGVSLMLDNTWSAPDAEFSSDTCLTRVGAWSNHQFFHFQLPQVMLSCECDINQLECATVVVSISLWGSNFKRKRLLVNCDNRVSAEVINSGFSRNPVLQACPRQLHLLCMKFDCLVWAKFVQGMTNKWADNLSR